MNGFGISLANGEHIIAKFLIRKNASSIFRYETLDGKYGEIDSTQIMGITML